MKWKMKVKSNFKKASKKAMKSKMVTLKEKKKVTSMKARKAWTKSRLPNSNRCN